MHLLHLTNGSAVIPKMREAGIDGPIVPWNDVLHEGPVPAGLNVAALRDVRAAFIAAGDGSYDEVVRSFAQRDAALDAAWGGAEAHARDADERSGAEAHALHVDEIVLWFEHDLYDQLQIIQILDRLPVDRTPLVTAVPGDDYLSPQPAARFAGLFPARREVTSAQRVAAHDAWEAFRSNDPRAIVAALPRITALPHLAPALVRHLQQFPAIENGLSRTEQQTLEAIARGVTLVPDVYVAANHDREEAVFMSDAAFLFHTHGLMKTDRPLIARAEARARATRAEAPHLTFDDELFLTDDGKRVLDGQVDRVALCGIDRWLGGVHLTGHGPVWRYDAARNTVRLA